MMHYPSNAFGGGKMTIQVLDSTKQHWIGQREGFSEIDKKQLNLMYRCGEKIFQEEFLMISLIISYKVGFVYTWQGIILATKNYFRFD